MVEIVAHNDAKRLLLLSQMPKQGTCAEIGVWMGRFSRTILRFTEPAILHLVDPWVFRPDYPRRWYGGKIAKSQDDMDKIFTGISSTFANNEHVAIHRRLSRDCVEEFPDKNFDWIYIDGNHLYEFVKQDLDSYYPKVKAGGFLCGDDYGTVGWWDNGVQKAVDEFVSDNSDMSLTVRDNQFMLQKGLGPRAKGHGPGAKG